MKVEKPCPACGKPITLWRVMAAPTPWHLKCGACSVRLRVLGLTVTAVVAALVIGLPLGWFAQGMFAAGQARSGILITVAAVAVFELLMSLLVLNSATLEPKV